MNHALYHKNVFKFNSFLILPLARYLNGTIYDINKIFLFLKFMYSNWNQK